MTNIADLRRYRIQAAAEALRRAGYRTTPPPDDEVDHWVWCVEAGEDEHDCPIHGLIWHPLKEAMAWQHARFGPTESAPPDSAEPALADEHDGQEERDRAGTWDQAENDPDSLMIAG